MTDFTTMLKALRKKHDLTQEQIAEYLNISPQAVSRWETGTTQPDITVLPLLSQLFGVTVDELLGINEKAKHKEINRIIETAEAKINNNDIESAINELRVALNKYPNNDRLLCGLMYSLYVASEDPTLCKKYDGEILSIANRIEKYSSDNNCKCEARSWLFRHYCDTDRKDQAMVIAEQMPSIETSLERCFYWALDGEDRLCFLTERIADDLRQLKWDIFAYTKYADIENNVKTQLQNSVVEAEEIINSFFDFKK